MKRLILPLIALSMLITSCIGGDVYESPSNDRTSGNGDLELITKTITVHPNQWVIDGTPGNEGAVLISEWSIRELSQYVLENGLVQVSYVFYDNNDNLVEHPLPYILPYVGSPANTLETYRWFAERGRLTLVIESSDFQCYTREGDLDFKVSILKYR
ncbi:MAG: hypothetical protein J6Z26_00535 [Bacteroidales bacterium]|nr:hypothetical protein [Bacteroidales bacterium]